MNLYIYTHHITQTHRDVINSRTSQSHAVMTSIQ